MKSNIGFTSDDQAFLLELIPVETLDQRKRDIKKLRERVEEKNGASAMRFYDLPISEERKKDLKDIVALKRRMVPHIDLEKRFTDLDKISDTFNEHFSDFMGGFIDSERSRVDAFNK